MTNVLQYIESLVAEYKYRVVPMYKAMQARELYRRHLCGFKEEGGGATLLPNGSTFSTAYTRVVVGDYGAYIEFTEDQLTSPLSTQAGQEYRTLPKYSRCKYEWLAPDGYQGKIKVYKQRHGVEYANYIPGRYYVSVFELIPKEA